MQRDAQIQVVGVVGDVHRGVIDRTRGVRRINQHGLDASPVVERPVNGDMLEIAGAGIDGEGQEYPDADCGDFRSPHIVQFASISYCRRQSAESVRSQEGQIARFVREIPSPVERLPWPCRRDELAESFPPAIHPAWNLRVPDEHFVISNPSVAGPQKNCRVFEPCGLLPASQISSL